MSHLTTFGAVGIGLLAAIGVAMSAWGNFRWKQGTRHVRCALAAARIPVTPARVKLLALEGLPAPVQRYLRLVLIDGSPMVAGVALDHIGACALRFLACSPWPI